MGDTRPDDPREADGNSPPGAETVAGTHASIAPETSGFADIGTNIGRYVVLDELGRGGTGRVMRAYDPKLQREVAIKIVHSERLRRDSSDRLLAEAHAMAKLSHPNVVGVFDVEVAEHQRLALVMEYVAGETLRTWLRERVCAWPDVIRVFSAAGRGLAAAHAVGVLHRDFKPANVLVGRDGSVKVMDFGLAKFELMAPSSSSGEHVFMAHDLSQSGVVLGTPRYMAPEQHRGQALTDAVDQYAFCIALWEALCDDPPFSGKDLPALIEAKCKGPPPWPNPAVPRAIAAAIVRGLSTLPSDRWPGMEALLRALAWDPALRRRRVRRVVGVLGVLGLAATAWSVRASPALTRCTDARAQLAGSWDARRRSEVEATLLGMGVAFATTAWDRTSAELDRYADAWVAMHTDACEATTARGEQSAAVMDLRMACLQRAKSALGAASDLLVRADADVVRNAYALTQGLLPLSRCADVAALQADVEPPLPSEREAVEEIRRLVADAHAADTSAHYAQAKQSIDAAKQALRHVSYGPVRAEIALVEGIVLDHLAEYDAAEIALREALFTASQWWQPSEVRDAATRLMHVVGARQERTAEGALYRALSQGLAQGDPAAEARVHSNYASILRARGEYAEAYSEDLQAVALREDALGPDPLEVADSRNNLAIDLERQAKYPEAEAEYRHALALREAALGPDHPAVAASRSNVAYAMLQRGLFAEAEAEARRALEIAEAALGPRHVELSFILDSVAGTLMAQGRYDEAQQVNQRTLALLEAALGPGHRRTINVRIGIANAFAMQGRYDESGAECRRIIEAQEAALGPSHPSLGISRHNLANVLYLQGAYVESEREYRMALALQEAALGVEHPDNAMARNNLASALAALGRLDEAEAEDRRALAMYQRLLEPGSPGIAAAQFYLADVLLARGKVAEALPLAEAAWRRRQQDDIAPEFRAETAFLLTRVLWAHDASPTSRIRAHALGEQALSGFEQVADAHGVRAKEVKDWLDQHPVPTAR